MTDLPAIDGLIETMTAPLAPLRQRRDPRRFFLATYLHTTQAVRAELSAGGFDDCAWVERWDVAFAQFYLDALEADLAHGTVSSPWAAAFASAGLSGRGVPPLQHVLLGMNAQINYGLPQASARRAISGASSNSESLITASSPRHEARTRLSWRAPIYFRRGDVFGIAHMQVQIVERHQPLRSVRYRPRSHSERVRRIEA